MTTPAGAFNVRWLVERAVALEAPPTRSKTHPLGLGLAPKKSYSGSSSDQYDRVPLPNFAEALVNLTRRVAEGVAHLNTDESKAAWSALLTHPAAVVHLNTGSIDQLLEREIVVTAEEHQRIREIGLAVVAAPLAEAIADGYLSGPRLAGTARLTVLMDSRRSHAVDAWLNASWTQSTRGLLFQLEKLYDDVPNGSRVSNGALDTVLVIDELYDDRLSEDDVMSLQITSALLGMRLVVQRLEKVAVAHAARYISARQPRFVIGVGSKVGALSALVGICERVNSQFQLLDSFYGGEPVDAARELLCLTARVSPALFPIGLAPVTRKQTRSKMPVSDPGRCWHDSGERAYVEDRATDLWWTRDTAHHAGAEFKTYTLLDGTLVHQACRDSSGLVMEMKHKSDVGRSVTKAELHSCSTGPHV